MHALRGHLVKRAGCLLDKICTAENFKLAWLKAVRGKSGSREVIQFRSDFEKKLEFVRKSLENGTFRFGRYEYFTINDPKKRTICAASFPERVVHHAIMNVLDPVFEKYQVSCSFACRKGKGTQAAILRAFSYAKKYLYYLKMDVRKYFDSIDHRVLKELLKRRLKDPNVLRIFDAIIDSYSTSPGKGIPIGNLTSQYFANHYLAVFDHHMKEDLRCGAYIRYMDDMVVFDSEKKFLTFVFEHSRIFLDDILKLEIKPKILDTTGKGVPFLGSLVKPSGIYLLRKSKDRFQAHAARIDAELKRGTISEDSAASRMTALAAHTDIARARNFRYRVFHGGRPRATTA